MIGGISILIGVGLWFVQRYGPTPRPEPIDPQDLRPLRVEQEQFSPQSIASDIADFANVPLDEMEEEDALAMVNRVRKMIFGTPIPVEESFVYDGIKFKGGHQVKMIFHMTDGGYMVPDFNVFQWVPGIFDSGVFEVGLPNAVAYEDYEERVILLVHSGKNQTMTVIQNYLELSESGYREPVEIADMRLLDMMIGNAEIYISQGQDYQYSKVAAAVRVPPSDVEEVSLHIMDLVDYLGETYPESQFDRLDENALVLYFCGRALAGEDVNPRVGHWTQARFVLGLVPMEVVDETLNSGQYRD
jgi:hypothetical protein